MKIFKLFLKGIIILMCITILLSLYEDISDKNFIWSIDNVLIILIGLLVIYFILKKILVKKNKSKKKDKSSNIHLQISNNWVGKKKLNKRDKIQLVIITILACAYIIDKSEFYIEQKYVFYGLAIVLSMIILILVIRTIPQKIKRRKLLKSGIDDIDKMDGRTFEIFLEDLFKRKGYRVELTPTSGDFGADLIVTFDKKLRVAVQAKRYNGNVGLSAVQEVVGAMNHYKCSKGLVVTNSGYTRQAHTLASSNNVELWGRERLMKEILQK